MGFLTPLFLTGLLALAVPILVHLTDRDRKNVLRFPSLRFLTRLPYRRTKRQRIRHPFLFALRTLALVLVVLAFSRPLLEGATVTTGAKAEHDVVIALDRSYSMSYGTTWHRAVEAARDRIAALPAGARAALLTFEESAQVVVPPTTDGASLVRELESLRPGSGATRFAPVLRLADEVLLDSPPGIREVVLVSDFQARAWDRSDPTRLDPGTSLTTIDLSTARPTNVMVADAGVSRSESEEGDGPVWTLTARLLNQGPDPIGDLPVIVLAEDLEVARGRVSLPASGGTTIRLGPIPLPTGGGTTRVTVGIGSDQLPADDVFYLTLSARPPVPVLLVEARQAREESSIYLKEALATAEEPAFEVVTKSVELVSPEDVRAASLVILHDSPAPGGAAGRALVDHVAGGGGLWVLAGGRSAPFPDEAAVLLPGTWQEAVDRLDARGVSLSGVDFDHPVFEIFAGPDDGNVSGPRYYRYRPLLLAETGARTLARYTDGAVALAEKLHGEGRVLLAGAPLDNRWSDVPVHPVFVPFVHSVARYLTQERARESSRQVGDVLDLADVLAEMGGAPAGVVTVERPSGLRGRIETESSEPLLALEEAGFYEVRSLAGGGAAHPIAVNVDRAESDLARLDVEAFAAASTVPADAEGVPAAARSLTREERERRQGVWWYLVLGALLLLVAESLWSNRANMSERATLSAGRQ